jgi:hypothetical protein
MTGITYIVKLIIYYYMLGWGAWTGLIWLRIGTGGML